MSSTKWTKTDETGVYRKGRRLRVKASKRIDGKIVHRQRTLPKGATLEEAIEARERLMDAIQRPDTPPEMPSTTIASYAAKWLARKAKAGLKPTTVDTYRGTLSRKILPQIGHLEFDEFDRRKLLDWIEWACAQKRTMREEVGKDDEGEPVYREYEVPYSTPTVRRWWRVLRNLLRDAYADGEIERDYTQRVPTIYTGRRGVRESETLTADELATLVETARQMDDDRHCQRYPEICTLAYTGMRSGELWALRWDDVDHRAGVLHIRRSVSSGEITDRTKTGVERTVPMHPKVAEAMRAHRRWMLEEQRPGFETGLVFPSQAGTPRTPGSLRKTLEAVAAEAKLDKHVTPQVLRRTWDTLMVLAGVDHIIGRAIIGHSSEEMTEHYAGIGMDAKRDALTRIFGQGGQ